jgi:predicted dehydrogenase
MSAQKLGFGFIGAGAIAHFHARAVAAADGGRLIGVVSRRRSSAEAFAKEHGIGFASDDTHAAGAARSMRCASRPAGAAPRAGARGDSRRQHLMIESC